MIDVAIKAAKGQVRWTQASKTFTAQNTQGLLLTPESITKIHNKTSFKLYLDFITFFLLI